MTTYPDNRRSVTEDSAEISPLNDLATGWVVAYRRNHPEADWWAEGFGAVEHSVETQERVFRMAEQLAGRAIDRLSVFAALRRADAVAQESSRRLQDSSTPAAVAGCGVIDTLLGAHGVVVNLLPPEAFEEQLGRAGQRWLPQPQAVLAIILLGRLALKTHQAHRFLLSTSACVRRPRPPRRQRTPYQALAIARMLCAGQAKPVTASTVPWSGPFPSQKR